MRAHTGSRARGHASRGTTWAWRSAILSSGLAAGALIVAPSAVGAQSTTEAQEFDFAPHLLSLTVRGGYDRPSGRSDIYTFTRQNLTLDRGDFAAGGLQLDLAVRLSHRFDVVATGGEATRSARSEFRNFIDNNDQPIEQTTRLRRVPFTLGLRYALHPAGERIGRFIWIPARVSTWVGAGGGTMHYAFSQFGDFVDFQTLNVFRQRLSSRGWAPMAYANLGADVRLSRNLWLAGDLRYSAARAPLTGSFYGFDRIDLSGTAASLGFTIRK